MIDLHPLVLFIVAAFWIFVLWMVWKVVQALKGIDESLKEIARSSQNRT
jgi:hypothetical protein